jgi:WD40 repeat protein
MYAMSRDQHLRLIGHKGPITCFALAHSDNWLVSGSEDSLLRIWNVNCALTQCNSDTESDCAGAGPGPGAGAGARAGGVTGLKKVSPASLCVGILAGHADKITAVSITPSDR